MKKSSLLFAVIVFLTAIPLTFQFTIGGDINYLMLRDHPVIGLGLGIAACLFALLKNGKFSKEYQLGLVLLFVLTPLTCFSLKNSEIITFVVWDYQPIIGWLYWATALILGYFYWQKSTSPSTN
ncbi:MAG: hypothetical protein ACPGVB_04955 [Chitinophagales bacterium]